MTRSVITASDASSGKQPNKDFPIQGSCEGGASMQYLSAKVLSDIQPETMVGGVFWVSENLVLPMAKPTIVSSAPRVMIPVSILLLPGML
jgi:hypothetical protein